jgi:hypothetical protein
MQCVTAMFHRDCVCEVVMLPLWNHLHGSYMMVLLLLLLVGIVLIAMLWHLCVCVCVCIQRVYSLAYERREDIGGADEGEQV